MKSSSETEVLKECYILHYDPYSAFVILIFHIEQGRLFRPSRQISKYALISLHPQRLS